LKELYEIKNQEEEKRQDGAFLLRLDGF